MRIKLLLLSLLIILDSPALRAQQSAVATSGEPIIINSDTLFKVYAGQGLFNTKERAEVITHRLNALVNKLDFNSDSLIVKNDTSSSVILYNSTVLLALNNKDASYSELNWPQVTSLS